LGVIISQKDIYGRVGIGDFTSQGVNQEPTHKLDVVGNGRFRYLPDSLNIADSSVTKYVMVDSLGVLRWTDAAPGGIGVACGDSINGKLIIDRHIDLNNNNFYFTNNDSIGQNHVGIGLPCASPLQGKLTVYQSHPKLITAVNPLTIAGLFVNTDSSQVGGTQFYGAIGYAVGNNMVKGSENTGGRFLAQNSYRSTGVRGMAISGDYNQGGHFEASGANYGNVGVYAKATASLNGSAGDAGIFEGNVTVYGDLTVSGAFNNPSDSMLKQNVMPLKHSDSLLNLLNPVTYNYKVNDFQQLHLDSTGQMGLIAQEVEPIFANVVHITTTLPVFDSLGNIITPAFTYKTLDYTKFIPVLIAGHQEQNSKIDSLQTSNDSLQLTVDSLIIVNNNQDSLINDLNNRLSHLENCLSGILPILCQMSHQSIQTNSPEVQQAIRSQLEIYLQNKEAIILDQNVPNPFAEQTVINFSIPESVKSAQIFFYDGMGKLIKTVDIRERGLGSITVFGSDLSSGTYMYTLVADGVNVATKKMVKE
jgi:hypothetical protein